MKGIKKRLSAKTYAVQSSIFAAGGTSILVYLWVNLGDRVVQADLQQNGDHINVIDMLLVMLALTFCILAARNYRQLDEKGKYKKRLNGAFLIGALIASTFCIAYSFRYA